MELFEYQSFHITKFLKNRDVIIWCTKSDADERVNIEVAMR